jgi:hypothetical protein
MSTVSSGPVIHPTHPVLRAVGHAAAVVGGGVVLLNLAFVAYAAVFQLVRRVAMLLAGGGPPTEAVILTANVVVLVVWLVAVRWATVWTLRRRPTGLGTAAWLAVPTASVLLPIGIALVDYPVAVTLTLCGLLVVGVLWLMARAHQPWEQLLSVAWVAVALAAMVLLGIDI